MSKEVLEGLLESTGAAVAYAKGDKAGSRSHRVSVRAIDVKTIRERKKLTQTAFCATYGLSLTSLRKWEQGTRNPDRTAQMYLTVIDKEPEAVERAIGD